MDRRTFLNWAGVGLVASSLPVAIAACSSGSPSGTGGAASDGFTAVGSLADLDKTGILLDEAKAIAVLRNPKATDQLIALDIRCTHQGCPVQWEGSATGGQAQAGQKQEFSCACHGARYAADGTVTRGPAGKPLKPLTVKQSGDQILVQT